MYTGQIFTTSNSEINALENGSTLVVVGKGQVQVTFVAPKPVPSFKPGDRINTKYGPSTVVRMTSRDGLQEEIPQEGEVLYVADGTHVVRVASVYNVTRR